MLRHLLPALLLSAGGSLAPRPHASQEPATAPPRVQEVAADDARLSFTPDSGRRARAALEAGLDGAEARAVALVALACAGAAEDLARIESAAADGQPHERRAALLALGELGAAGLPALERALARDTAGLEGELCVALLVAERRGVPAAGMRLEELARSEADGAALAEHARAALSVRAGEPAGALSEALAFRADLRRRAARAYGLVDGLRGRKHLASELFADEEFLDRVVLAAAAELPGAELKSHLTEILLGGERPGALRVAALVMPDDLARAIQGGEWRPSLEGWRALLAEIDARRAEGRAETLLGQAFRAAPELESSAGRLLVRAGGDLPWSWVLDQLEKGDAEQRSALVAAFGDRGEKERIPELSELRLRRADLGVDAELLVALARLGHSPAHGELEDLVSGPASEERDRAVLALARLLHDRGLWRFAEIALGREDLVAPQRIALQAALARHGARSDRALLREALAQARDALERRALILALAREPEPADLDALAALFPLEDDLEGNVDLALVLLSEHHPATGGLLSAALWSEGWNRSVLAGGLIIEAGGVRALVDELAAAPRTATEADMRRVGFALGEWGGLAAVEEFARARSEGDPALQGAVLGALSSRAADDSNPTGAKPRVRLEPPPKPPGAGAKKRRKGGKKGF